MADRIYQTKKPIDADNDDLLQASEDAMYHIQSALEALRGYWDLDHIFEALDDAYDDLKELHEHYDVVAMQEYNEEIEALNRDYIRSVLPL